MNERQRIGIRIVIAQFFTAFVVCLIFWGATVFRTVDMAGLAHASLFAMVSYGIIAIGLEIYSIMTPVINAAPEA